MRKISFIAMFLFFFTAAPFTSNASTLFFMPQSAEYQESDTFIKSLHIDTKDQKINTLEAKINFDQNALEVIDVITGDSVIELWMGEPVISNKNGSIEFTGGIPGGYSGNGIILKIIFKAKKTGSCKLSLSDTKTLLNDGMATEDEISILDNSYNIVEKSDSFIKIESKSNPDENKWSNNDTFSLHWDLVDEADYSYILSKDPLAEPDEIPDRPKGELVWMGSMSYEELKDDIYYFHLKQKLPDEKWSPKITVRTMVDTTSPKEFTPQIIDIEGMKYLVFATTDAASGIDYYKVSETGLNWLGNIKPKQETKWEIAKSPYLLKDQSLKSIIKVKANDKAGNERLSEVILPSKPKFFPSQITFWILIGTTVIILIIWIIFWRKSRDKEENHKK
ncbi:hypothetical protein KAT63_03955 [Candidatus Parcubacteria bacterium]|nr:hypothetical protein [Candidatus Parcubacteria bacterium]